MSWGSSPPALQSHEIWFQGLARCRQEEAECAVGQVGPGPWDWRQSRALWSLSLWGQRQKRLCQYQEACMWTSLAAGIPLHFIPQSCLLPALPSRGEMVGGAVPSIAAVSRSPHHGTPARVGGEGIARQGVSDWHPSFPWNSQPRGSSGSTVEDGHVLR